MNLCFFINSLDYGGAEISLINLINYLPVQNKITLVVWNKSNSCLHFLNEYWSKNINIYCLDDVSVISSINSSKFRNISKLLFLRNYVYKNSFDAIINYHFQGNYHASAIKYNIPSIAWFHGCANKEAVNDFGYLLQNKKVQKYTDMVIFVSEEVKQNAINNFELMNNCEAVYNIIPYERIIESKNAYCFNLENVKYNIVTVGRLSKEKGFDLAVKCADILNKRGLAFKWYFVGDGPELNHLTKMVSTLGLNDNIDFLGFKSNPFPIIANCDLYVQPSYNEAYPLSVCEAKVLSTPVVTTATIGGCSLIKDGYDGKISDINEHSLADNIELLLTNKQLYSNIVNNLNNADYELYNKNIVDKFLKIIKTVTDNKYEN